MGTRVSAVFWCLVFCLSSPFGDGLAATVDDSTRTFNAGKAYRLPSNPGHKIRIKKIKHKEDLELKGFSSPALDASQASFSLFASEDLPFRGEVLGYLEPYGISNDIEVKLDKEITKPTGRFSVFYQFMIDGLKIDYYMLKASKQKDGSIFMTGSLPDVDDDQSSFYLSKFPSDDSLRSYAAQFLESIDFAFKAEDMRLSFHRPCATVVDSFIKRAICVQARANERAYDLIIAEDGVSQFHAASFHATARLKNVYTENPNSGKADHVVDVTSTKYLQNSRFTILPGDGQRLVSVGSEFKYTADDSSAARQIHAFSFANRMFDWYDSLGFSGAGRQITIRTGVSITGADGVKTDDNAAFFPSEWRIDIGKGSGQGLQNLGLDIDVVAHEVGHFIVFQGINEISPSVNEQTGDHTAAIHEGLADYFTYASTGDTCLGNTVCPANSPYCFKKIGPQLCLRVGSDIGFKYGDATYNSLPGGHLKGQLVAAFLYEARSNYSGDDLFSFDQVIVNAMDYVPAGQVSYGDLILGIMASDKELQNGKFCKSVYDAALAYDLGMWINADAGRCSTFNSPEKTGAVIDKDKASLGDYSPITQVNNSKKANPSLITTGEQGSDNKNSSNSKRNQQQTTGGCSTLGLAKGSAPTGWLWLVFALPFLIPVFYAHRENHSYKD